MYHIQKQRDDSIKASSQFNYVGLITSRTFRTHRATYKLFLFQSAVTWSIKVTIFLTNGPISTALMNSWLFSYCKSHNPTIVLSMPSFLCTFLAVNNICRGTAHTLIVVPCIPYYSAPRLQWHPWWEFWKSVTVRKRLLTASLYTNIFIIWKSSGGSIKLSLYPLRVLTVWL